MVAQQSKLDEVTGQVIDVVASDAARYHLLANHNRPYAAVSITLPADDSDN